MDIDEAKAKQKAKNMTEKAKAARKRYAQTEKSKAIKLAYNISEPGRVAKRKYGRSDKNKVAQKRYFQSDKYKAKMKERYKDPQFRLMRNLRVRFNRALRGKVKNGSAVLDLGCSIPHFKLYIENQFDPGMSWANYGEWHLDHVFPLSHFDLTERSQLLEACNWLNYQPLWALDNARKGARI